jgi:hypothetical protein
VHHSRRIVPIGAAAVLLGLLLPAREAAGIPAFARKYQASCQTCHIAYPKLNAFGQAFRLLGYRMPGETDEMVAEKPVSLGSPAWKRLWPKALWPSHIPRQIPLAARIILPVSWTSELDDDERSLVQGDFQFPSTAFVQAAGTFGEKFSFFSKLQISREETAELVDDEIHRSEEIELDFEHAEIHANSIVGPTGALNLKIGRFEPEMVGISFSHMRPLTSRNYANMFAFSPIAVGGGASVAGGGHAHGGLPGLAVPTTVEGIEAYGISKHRLFWNLGIANGLGPGVGSSDGNSLKDIYGRLSYKTGGIGFDGTSSKGFVSPSASKPWRDNSVTLGIFAYRGNGEDVIFTVQEHGQGHGAEEPGDEHGDEHGDALRSLGAASTEEQGDEHGDEHGEEASLFPIEDERFQRWGFDIHWYYQDLHLFRSSWRLIMYSCPGSTAPSATSTWIPPTTRQRSSSGGWPTLQP